MDSEEAARIENEMRKMLKSAVSGDKRRGGQRVRQRRQNVSLPHYLIGDDLSDNLQFKSRYMAIYHDNHELIRFSFQDLVKILGEFEGRITEADRKSLAALQKRILKDQ